MIQPLWVANLDGDELVANEDWGVVCHPEGVTCREGGNGASGGGEGARMGRTVEGRSVERVGMAVSRRRARLLLPLTMVINGNDDEPDPSAG